MNSAPSIRWGAVAVFGQFVCGYEKINCELLATVGFLWYNKGEPADGGLILLSMREGSRHEI